MKRNALKAMAMASLWLFAGCATNQVDEVEAPPPVITTETLDKIRSTKVVVGVDLTSQSQAMQGTYVTTGHTLGMIGVMVDMAVNATLEHNRLAHERLMVEIQNAAINFNFGGHFKNKFESAVRQLSWLRVVSVVREPVPQRSKIKALAAEAKEDAVLIADVGYVIAPDLSGFSITAYTVLRLREDQSQTSAAPVANSNLFQRKYFFQYPLEQAYTDKEQASRAWAENGGLMVERALQAGISDTIQKIKTDLEGFRAQPGKTPLTQRTP